MVRASVLAGVLLAGIQAQAGWEAERTKALQLRLDDRMAEAVKVLEAAVARYPKEAGAHYELADVLLAQTYADSIVAAAPADGSRVPRLERIVAHFRRAMALDAQYRQIASAKLVSVYEEDDFRRPEEVERLSRDLIAMDPASPVWAIKLSHGLAAQQRCSEAARVLVAARSTVDRDRLLVLGMAMPDLFLKCDSMSLDDARPLLGSADAIATEILKTTPDDRDVLMMQAAALTALASKLPEGPEKAAVEARGTQVFGRFMEANPTRQAALRGEAPERVYDGFAYMNEFLSAGKTQEAHRLLESMKTKHAASAEFWSSAAWHHQQRGERDAAIAAAKRHVELAPRGPERYLLLGSLYAAWALDETRPPADRAADLEAAQSSIDAALAAGPDHTGALLHKADLLKTQAGLEQDATRKQALLAESGKLMAKAAKSYKSQPRP